MAARILAALFTIAAICSCQAQAAPVTISGSGQFGPSDIPDPVYRIDTSFSFSFAIDTPLSSNPSLDLVAASYTLGGAAAATPLAVEFFGAADGGLFSLGFDDGSALSFFGDDIGSGGTLVAGIYDGAVFGSAEDYGSAVITVSAIPLPPSLASLGAMLALFLASKRGAGPGTTRGRALDDAGASPAA